MSNLENMKPLNTAICKACNVGELRYDPNHNDPTKVGFICDHCGNKPEISLTKPNDNETVTKSP